VLNDDFTLSEFLEWMETYEFRTLPYPEPASLLCFHRQVLELADQARQATEADRSVSFARLAQLTGTGVQPGAFWTIVDWLGEHGLPVNGDGTGIYLHPVGDSFLRGYRAFGHDPDRWDELVNQCVAEGLPDE